MSLRLVFSVKSVQTVVHILRVQLMNISLMIVNKAPRRLNAPVVRHLQPNELVHPRRQGSVHPRLHIDVGELLQPRTNHLVRMLIIKNMAASHTVHQTIHNSSNNLVLHQSTSEMGNLSLLLFLRDVPPLHKIQSLSHKRPRNSLTLRRKCIRSPPGDEYPLHHSLKKHIPVKESISIHQDHLDSPPRLTGLENLITFSKSRSRRLSREKTERSLTSRNIRMENGSGSRRWCWNW